MRFLPCAVCAWLGGEWRCVDVSLVQLNCSTTQPELGWRTCERKAAISAPLRKWARHHCTGGGAPRTGIDWPPLSTLDSSTTRFFCLCDHYNCCCFYNPTYFINFQAILAAQTKSMQNNGPLTRHKLNLEPPTTSLTS